MDAVGGFSLRVEQGANVVVVWLSGEVDIATSPMLNQCLQELNGQAITIDFSDVTFLDSSALRVLVLKHNESGDGRLVLRGVRPEQMKVFEITALDEVLRFDNA